MLKRVGSPQGNVISLDDLKAHLRVDTSDDDGLLRGYLAAATATAESATGRVLLPSGFEYVADGFSCLDVPAVPLRGDASLVYLDPAGVEQTADTAGFYTIETSSGFRVVITSVFTWPTISSRADAVRVRFQAGYDAADPVPDPVLLPPDPRDRLMILLLVAHWYGQREATGSADLQSVPLGFEMLVTQRRIYR